MWGAGGPRQVKPHTARGAQDPRRTTKSDEILQLLLGSMTTAAAHTHVYSNRLTNTHPWLRVMRVYYYCVETKCPGGRKTSWGFLWTLRPPRQREGNTALRRPRVYTLDCYFKSAVFTLHIGTEIHKNNFKITKHEECTSTYIILILLETKS